MIVVQQNRDPRKHNYKDSLESAIAMTEAGIAGTSGTGNWSPDCGNTPRAPDGSIEDIYHKIKLVPFIEHFPFKEQYPPMWEFLQKSDTSNWLAGNEWKVMDAGGLKIFTPICFEDVLSDHIRRFVLKGGDIIANISNDYWSLSLS